MAQKLQNMKFIQKKVALDQLVGEEQEQVVVTEVVEIPCEKPPAEQIITVIIENVCAEYDVIRGKVLVDGTLCFKILYVADMSNHPQTYQQPVFAFEDCIPFSAMIEIDCIRAGMDAIVSVVVEDVKATLMGVENEMDECEIEDREGTRKIRLRFVLAVKAKVTKTKDIEVIVDVESDEC